MESAMSALPSGGPSGPSGVSVVSALKSNHVTIAVAESCTGGLLASTLTNVEGSSQCVVGGVVVYTPLAKARLLHVRGVDPRSEACARCMTEALCATLPADIHVGVTGTIESLVFFDIFYLGAHHTHSVTLTANGREANKRIVVDVILEKLENYLRMFFVLVAVAV